MDLDKLTNEELKDLEYNIHKVQQKRRKEKSENKLQELKEKYSGKYFLIDDGIYYIRDFTDEYTYMVTFLKKKEELLKEDCGWQFYTGESRTSDIFSPWRSMRGDILSPAPIDTAKELTPQEVKGYLERFFENMEDDFNV